VPQPRFSDIRRFCSIDGWEELGRVRGGTGDHRRYRKILADGTVLRTRASHSNEQIADPSLWQRIWREQLGLESEDQFWDAFRTGDPVQRPAQARERPTGSAIPTWVVHGLLRAGIREEEIRDLDAAEARRRLEDLWSQPPAAE
jgi:hypothetical protein